MIHFQLYSPKRVYIQLAANQFKHFVGRHHVY